jgi:hypothetical protein
MNVYIHTVCPIDMFKGITFHVSVCITVVVVFTAMYKIGRRDGIYNIRSIQTCI